MRPESLAVLPFENQTGDASLDWTERAVQTLLVTHTGARVIARDWNDAHQPGIQTALSATIRREGPKLVIEAVAHSIGNHRQIFTARVEGGSGPDQIAVLVSDLARRITPELHLSGLRNPASLLGVGQLFESRTTDELAERCLAFLESEPGFSPAYESCVASLGSAGRIAEVKRVLALSSGREKELSYGARTAIAEGHFRLGNLKEASAYYRTLTAVDPAKWNQIIYAEGLQGNLEQAGKAYAEYVRAVPREEPNAFDSMGEVHFFTGKYPEAERHFLAGVQKFPAFQDGIGKLKAAASRLAAGDAKGAEAVAMDYFDTQRRKENRNLPALQAVWKQISAAYAADGAKAVPDAVERALMRRPAPSQRPPS